MDLVDIVKKVRDMTPNRNTLILLDELIQFEPNVIVFTKNIEKGIQEESCYTLIDEIFISDKNLAKPDDSHYEERLRDVASRWNNISERKKKKNYKEICSELDQAMREYDLLRPSVLVQKIKNADLVLGSKGTADKLSEEIPAAKIGILEHGRINLELRQRISGKNYPRVFIKHLLDDEKPRIDEHTINLLFKQEEDSKSDWNEIIPCTSSGHNRIDQSFYTYFNEFKEDYTNPIKKSTFKMKTSKGLIEVPANSYDMSIRQGRFRWSATDFLELIRAKKVKEIKEFYEELWVKPHDSIDLIIDRQVLITRLINETEYTDKLRELEKALNKIYEPYLHISSMSKLISARILHSKWGGRIKKNRFYNDFKKIAGMFSKEYEKIKDITMSLKPVSREMQVILIHLKDMISETGSLNSTYEFLKKTLGDSVNNFYLLQKVFEKELKKKRASKIDELETYNYLSDEEVMINYRREKTGTLEGYKSGYLNGLLKRFHEQNPVTSCENVIEHLNYYGSKIAAYNLIAYYLKNKNWSKAEFTEEEGLVKIINGWYPLTRLQHSSDFIRNKTSLNSGERVELIDGPNITGKTIDMKKSIFIAVSALTNGYVPAEYAKISFFDKVGYRIKTTGMKNSGALAEDLNAVQSMLDNLGLSILVGIDELPGTSTNNVEGEALTYGLVKRIAKNKKARAILTSHYPELQEILDDKDVSGVKFSHFEFKEENGELKFPHKKIDGPNKLRDYAIPIAQTQGVSPGVIRYATKYLGKK